jgi:hypothetical protein
MIFIEKPSRKFSLLDVPDPVDLKVKFVYNFFTPDERINKKGDKRVPGDIRTKSTQRLINAKTLRSEVPRFIELNFSPGTLVEFGNLDDQKNSSTSQSFELQHIQEESSITTDSFMTIHESDPDVKLRASQKLKALSALLEIPFEDSFQTQKISQETGIPQGELQSLISPSQKSLIVNFAEPGKNLDLYDIAANFKMNLQLNMRSGNDTYKGSDDASPLSSVSEKEKISSLTNTFLSRASKVIVEGDIDASISPFRYEIVSSDTILGIESASHVGYVLSKKQMSPSGKKVGAITDILIRGTESTRFLDTKIVYGSKYSYNVRNVYQISCILRFPNDNSGSFSKARVVFFIKSKPSGDSTVLTEEFVAPRPPDGIFYRFNYDQGRGLVMTWQPPAGKSRDVKYFQIFRRYSIYEPFSCIGQIDFDNSLLKTLKPESIRADLTRKTPGMETFFEDTNFIRESRPSIYAVVAVDAHGFTSQYSSQTKVFFDKVRNKIVLKNISRPGAPKQYPNFFIDPRLDDNIAVDSFSQDALFDSGRKKVKIYFTPDARLASDKNGNNFDVFTTNQKLGKYKMHVLNIDFQKSANVEIQIQDLQTT